MQIDEIGIHSSRPGYTPGSLFYLKGKDKKVALSFHKDDPKDYLKRRIATEKNLRAIAKKKIGKDIQRYPIYFTLGSKSPFTDDVESLYTLDKSLLDKATYTINDSFRGTKAMTLAELKAMNDIPNLSGKNGEYIEGQLWSPFEISGKNIIAKKKI